MRKYSLLFVFSMFIIASKSFAQEAVRASILTNWGTYVKTNLAGASATLLQVRIDGQNHIWSGIFSINGSNSYTPDISWNNVRLLSYSNYNTNKDDVKVLLMSNSTTSGFGGTEIVVKSENPVVGSANLYVTVLGGYNASGLALTDNATISPFPHIIASSESTLNMWTVGNKVGIGTNSPRTKLDLGGVRLGDVSQFPAEGSLSESDWPTYIIGNDNLQQLRLGLVNDSYTRAEIDMDNSNRPDGTIALKTTDGNGGAVVRMFVHGNGNIGIGTGSALLADYKLSVKGTIGATKIKVTQTGWPDYVFESNYKMRTIPELEVFIKEYKHLPDVPSEKEIMANGLDLGNNQATLLRKIEELSLYLIDQNRKIEAQQKEIEQLRSRNTSIERLYAEVEKLKKAVNVN